MLGNFWLKRASPWGTAVVLKGFWPSPQVLQRMVAGALATFAGPSPAPGAPPGAAHAARKAAVAVVALSRVARRVLVPLPMATLLVSRR